jgi:hypothetical protein
MYQRLKYWGYSTLRQSVKEWLNINGILIALNEQKQLIGYYKEIDPLITKRTEEQRTNQRRK